MLIAPGIAEWSEETPHPGVAQLLRHESDHLWDWMMGEPFRFAANERRAQAGDALVRSLYTAEQRPWPHPFRYPNARDAEMRQVTAAA